MKTEWYPMHVGGFITPWRVAVSTETGTGFLIADMRVMKFKTFDHANVMAKYLNAPEELRLQVDGIVSEKLGR
jgi:hypothetical protein